MDSPHQPRAPRAEEPFETRIDRVTNQATSRPAGVPGAWAAFTSAAGSALALAFNADAAVVYSGPRNIAVTMPATSARTVPLTGPVTGPGRVTVGLDIDGGGNDVILSATFGAHSTLLGSGTPYSSALRRLGGLGVGGAVVDAIATGWISGWMENHAPGDLIEIGPTAFVPNPGILFQRTTIQVAHQPYYSVNRGYFVPPRTFAGGGTRIGFGGFQLGNGNLGWIRLKVERREDQPYAVTAIDWAYEDSGGPIRAGEGLPGAIPEGSTGLATLALGAMGVLAYRHRRRANPSRDDAPAA